MRYNKIQKKWGKILRSQHNRVEKKLHIKLIQLMNKKKKKNRTHNKKQQRKLN